MNYNATLSDQDLEAIVEELAAVVDKKTLLDIYNLATSEPLSFLFVNLMSHDNKLFHIKSEKTITVENVMKSQIRYLYLPKF
jgi:hypothetical protein